MHLCQIRARFHFFKAFEREFARDVSSAESARSKTAITRTTEEEEEEEEEASLIEAEIERLDREAEAKCALPPPELADYARDLAENVLRPRLPGEFVQTAF